MAGMLLRNPKEFEHVAREWAIKYAGAPRREIAEGSGGSNAEMLKKKAQMSREKEEKAKMAA